MDDIRGGHRAHELESVQVTDVIEQSLTATE
jgi:hypothetical protein